ncbi:PQ loop repeat-domain-containing protein [Kalaharituber pfeilii]|nr:PQ loop repeat-domain-containing protein [Kalaharituber pfeilii]
MLEVPPSLSTREALSGIAGSISLASWILLLVPQLVENFKNGNADGISTAFLLTWLVGDISNLIGSIWARLLPTVIALAVYFCFADFVLLTQVLYYNRLSKSRPSATAARRHSHTRRHNAAPQPSDGPTQPLLPRRDSISTQSITYRRQSFQRRRDSLSAVLEKRPSTSAVVTRNAVAIVGTCLAGTLGWLVAWKTGAWSAPNGDVRGRPQAYGAEILGYISAALYLGARIPQIIQNYRKQSCEGLSVLFFMLSLLGNLTYGAGILFHSTEQAYVVDNLPWLLGSLGTMVEDVIIFCQFRLYKVEDEDEGPDSSAVV